MVFHEKKKKTTHNWNNHIHDFPWYNSVWSRGALCTFLILSHRILKDVYSCWDLIQWIFLIVSSKSLKSISFFLPFFKFIFYWRIIALQNFAICCQTSTWTDLLKFNLIWFFLLLVYGIKNTVATSIVFLCFALC